MAHEDDPLEPPGESPPPSDVVTFDPLPLEQ